MASKRYRVEYDKAAHWWDVIDPVGGFVARYAQSVPAADLARRLNVGHRLAIKLERKRAAKAAAARRKRLLPKKRAPEDTSPARNGARLFRDKGLYEHPGPGPKKRTPEAIDRAVQNEVAEARRKHTKGGKRKEGGR